MDRQLIAEADRLVARLSAGKQESVREIVISAARRGTLDDRGRAFLDRVTGSSLVAEVLVAAISESAPPETREIGHESTQRSPAHMHRTAFDGDPGAIA